MGARIAPFIRDIAVRQIGILKALGASRAQILAVYLTMVLIRGLSAGAIAIPPAVSSGYAFSSFVAGQLNFEILTRHLPMHVYLFLAIASVLLPILLSLSALLRAMMCPCMMPCVIMAYHPRLWLRPGRRLRRNAYPVDGCWPWGTACGRKNAWP